MKKRMHYLWLVLAILCIIYFIVCVTSVGFTAKFNFVWLFGAVFCVILFFITDALASGRLILPMWLKAGLTALFAIAVVYFIVLEGLVISKMNSKPEAGADYVLVLGARVNGDTVSAALALRLDAAYEYVSDEMNRECKIIVAGGKGSGENVSEGYAMKQYLIAKGIDGGRIFVEDLSTDTNENISFSKELYIQDSSKSVVIVSNNFHMYRALRLARANGLDNASGICAPCQPALLLNYMVREAVGITKEIVFGNF